MLSPIVVLPAVAKRRRRQWALHRADVHEVAMRTGWGRKLLARLEVAIEEGRIAIPKGGNAAVADVVGPAMSLATWAELLTVLFREQFPVHRDTNPPTRSVPGSAVRVAAYSDRAIRQVPVFHSADKVS